ncbi:MAG: hypothetical protein EXR83_07885 [Gammaproteobacteria bacterium]|nr:hypothetical protein [Gammaproteobacteria bacterium]
MNQTDSAMAQLLNARYGDGGLYTPHACSGDTRQQAVAAGFVSEEGFVTRKGRAFIARTSSLTTFVRD